MIRSYLDLIAVTATMPFSEESTIQFLPMMNVEEINKHVLLIDPDKSWEGKPHCNFRSYFTWVTHAMRSSQATGWLMSQLDHLRRWLDGIPVCV